MRVHYEVHVTIGNKLALRVGTFDTRKEAVEAMNKEDDPAYVVKVTREVTNRKEAATPQTDDREYDWCNG